MMVSAEYDPRQHGMIRTVDLDQEMPAILPRVRVEFRPLDFAPALASSTASLILSEVSGRLKSRPGCYAPWANGQADLVIERVLVTRPVGVIGLPGVPESISLAARRAFLNDRAQVCLNTGSTDMKENRK